ncbi:MAG TPA: hypothetical protein VI306_18610 [Pyrinomonadaceae bacterium]
MLLRHAVTHEFSQPFQRLVFAKMIKRRVATHEWEHWPVYSAFMRRYATRISNHHSQPLKRLAKVKHRYAMCAPKSLLPQL